MPDPATYTGAVTHWLRSTRWLVRLWPYVLLSFPYAWLYDTYVRDEAVWLRLAAWLGYLASAWLLYRVAELVGQRRRSVRPG